jgi:DNA-directed RNA polymerase specialized sigma24 family protein
VSCHDRPFSLRWNRLHHYRLSRRAAEGRHRQYVFAWLRAFDRIDQFDIGRAFAPWFLRILLNQASNAVARALSVALTVNDPACSGAA